MLLHFSSNQAVVDVKYVPRFIGEWGDLTVTLKDKSLVEFRSLPHFREIAKYIEKKAEIFKDTDVADALESNDSKPKGFGQ